MTAKPNIRVISLGGRGEVGNNMIILENEQDLLILDCGVLFPETDLLGFDLIMPDISYLLEKKDKIRGLVISHGHEDHIGGIPYLYKQLTPPIYGTDITLALIKGKLEQAGLDRRAVLKQIKEDKKIELGSFELEFCHVNHSIPGSVAMGIRTPVGLLVYTGDYKFDQTPVNNPQTDFQKLADWGKEGVLALLGDSTNAEREGHSLSERIVARNLEEGFRLINQRIIIATFSSNIHRIQHIIQAGFKTGRKLAISGRSMLNTIKAAASLGYIDIPEGMLISLDEANKLDPAKVILLMTGSQGEHRAALTRMARGDHRDVKILPGDTIFLSASPIPGNEVAVGETINMLYNQGADVIYNGMLDVHASGHACQEELKMMLNLTRPKFLVPVHGEFRHLYHHAQLGRQVGIPVEGIMIIDNGEILEVTADSARITGKVKSGKVYIENDSVVEGSEVILNDRKRLARNGFVTIFLQVDEENKLTGEPVLISRGFIFMKESRDLLHEAKSEIKKIFSRFNRKDNDQWSEIKKEIINSLSSYFYEQTYRSPLIIPYITKLKED